MGISGALRYIGALNNYTDNGWPMGKLGHILVFKPWFQIRIMK
jgi:hypothetical protein